MTTEANTRADEQGERDIWATMPDTLAECLALKHELQVSADVTQSLLSQYKLGVYTNPGGDSWFRRASSSYGHQRRDIGRVKQRIFQLQRQAEADAKTQRAQEKQAAIDRHAQTVKDGEARRLAKEKAHAEQQTGEYNRLVKFIIANYPLAWAAFKDVGREE